LASNLVGVTVTLVVPLLTLAVYAVVADANTGLNDPAVVVSVERSALLLAALVIVVVYVLVVVPSCAVTLTSIVLVPIFNVSALDAVPLDTVV
jgi:hypothetical protein